MLREGLLALSESGAARKLVTHAPFSRQAARRFVAGETVDDLMRAAREVNALGMTATVDYLGESVQDRADARAAANVYIEVLDRIEGEGLQSNVSLKLTQMGQDIDDDFLRENVGRVFERAMAYDTFVRLDMESSDYTQRTLDFFRSIRERHPNVGVVLQSYLYRTEDDVREMNELGARVRLCKGAYAEPESVAYQDKSDVDANFVACARLLLREGVYPGIATHDERMIDAAKRYAAEQDIPIGDFEFQMLYGVRRDVQRQLVDEGYNLRIYIPFGEAWYPYLMRRMAERPANFFFIMNAILRESPLSFLTRR